MSDSQNPCDGKAKRLKNLKPFKKGHKSKGGRPKGVVTIGAYYRDWLEADENLQAVTAQLLKHKPDVILHYAYGKPVETNINLNSDQTSPEAIADALARLRVASKKVDAVGQPVQSKSL